MNDLEQALSSLTPFNFLKPHEIHKLINASTIKHYKHQQIIYSVKDSKYDSMSILLKGTVVVKRSKKIINTIHTPSYFGERAVLFGTKRKASIVARGSVECLQVPGEAIRHLINSNKSFSQSFSESMVEKHNIFDAYHQFVNLLYKYRHEESLNISDIIPYYKALEPLLHRNINDEEINFSALTYVMSRLPNNITSLCDFFLSDDVQPMFLDKIEFIRDKTARASKRAYLNILPGKLLVVLRDEMTDFIDFVTKLCVYYCESQKIIHKLVEGKSLDEDHQNIVSDIIENHLVNKQDTHDDVLKKLPLSLYEKKNLKKLLGNNIIHHLYGMMNQHGDLGIRIKKPDARYAILSREIWIHHIQQAFEAFIMRMNLSQHHEVHIIFSNTHSVNNCLSNWVHEHQDTIIAWGKIHVPEGVTLKNPSDQLYLYTRYWLKAHPRYYQHRVHAEEKSGFTYVKDTHLNGIDVNFICLSHLSKLVDPYLSSIDKEKFNHKIIINVDYAYGHQAESCMRNIILLFGKKIKSISITGKIGGIIGKRGDIIIPYNTIIQKDNALLPILNQALKVDNIKDTGFLAAIHRGNMLTVLGTLMQNREMLSFYKLFWDVAGIEMEGTYYVKEINSAIVTGLLSKSVAVHAAYYISDTPLKASHNLAKPLLPQEGIPAVYSITRAILRRILLGRDA